MDKPNLTVFRVSSKCLSVTEVVSILLEPPVDKISSISPAKPKGGEIYLFRSSTIEEKDDWRSDQYRWKNWGVHKLPKKDPKVQKSYFQISRPNGPSSEFVKHAYELLPLSNSNTILVHYIGDENAAVDYAHGNAKSESSRLYVRTCPSILQGLKKECKTNSAVKVYRSQITQIAVPTHLSVKQPRDIKQVKNVRYQVLGKQRLTHDALYNLHELAIDMPNFVHLIHTHPDLVCVCGKKELLDELDRILLIESPSAQLLSYDTTFQLGDFYISVLAFRHVLFKEAPVIPACFLIHERKFQSAHEQLFTICCKQVSSLQTTTKPIVTDEEQAFVNTMKKYLVNSPHLRCWNHIFRDLKRWLQTHGASTLDISIYLSDVKDLFHLPSEKEYNDTLKEMAGRWSAPFYHYYQQHIHTDISCIARWAIEPLGIYNPFSGVTSNQAESLNCVLKRLSDWREAPVDCMVLALYYLQSYFQMEIYRGKLELGSYHLYSVFCNFSECEPPFVPDEHMHVYNPEDIVERIKGNLTVPSAASSQCETSSQSCTNQLTQEERARHVLETNKLSFDPKLHTFTIMGSNKPHVVTLFPKEHCSCPATSQCYHIVAAKLSIGKSDETKSKVKCNLTQLRKNSRSRKDKTSGQKRPRPADYDVLPALDAVAADYSSRDNDVDPDSDSVHMDGKSLQPGKVDADNNGHPRHSKKIMQNSTTLEELPQKIKQKLNSKRSQLSQDITDDKGYSPLSEKINTIFTDVSKPELSQKSKCPRNQMIVSEKKSPDVTDDVKPVELTQKSKCTRKLVNVSEKKKPDVADDGKPELPQKRKRTRKLVNVEEFDFPSRAAKNSTTRILNDYTNLIFSIKNGEQLNDNHVNAANRLLQSQFSELQGLASPVLGQKLCFPNFDDILGYSGQAYMQVLHNGSDHWITIEIVSKEEVHIYDSLFLKPNYCIIKQISSIIQSKSHQVQLLLEKVQFQRNAIDCGVYAIAFLTDLCHKIDPSARHYPSSKKLREHLIHCFQEGMMTPFSSIDSSKQRPSVMNVNLYCSCRQPYALEHVKPEHLPLNEDAQMIQCYLCDRWYHRSCVDISEERIQELSNSQETWVCEFRGCNTVFHEMFDSD